MDFEKQARHHAATMLHTFLTATFLGPDPIERFDAASHACRKATVDLLLNGTVEPARVYARASVLIDLRARRIAADRHERFRNELEQVAA